VELLLSEKDRSDILSSDPQQRKLLFRLEILAIEDGEVVANVEQWRDLETQKQARARLGQ
jgi:hypothetical protein